ncbi:phosphotransferase [Plantactinospora sp. KLBMP9567]|uniref:phosphotransferase n=1 Tax=Plantactinospora sp. KLBMP9567 TaxID=3085900 RepID=UPI002981EEAF|nr:phosphotransferase [Plantactinospora sp. KLBMP9567]MDW5322471.1 phosphotransferase [Plantactinospora sp. KLBMP9567]
MSTTSTIPTGRSGDRQLALLTGAAAEDVLRAALRPSGGELLDWRAVQVEHQPGRRVTAAYQARIRWPDGRVRDERLAACTGRAPAGTVVLGNGTDRVAAWRFPYDPALPALRGAYDEGGVAALLRDLGLGDGPVDLRVRAYRPRRRAVIEAAGAGGSVFLKVVRPEQVSELHDRHRLLVRAGVPAAPSLGYTPDGLLVLQALPGQSLRQALRGRAPLPSGRALLHLLDQLPAELTRDRPRRSWREKAPHYASMLATALPGVADQATALAAALTDESTPGPPAVVHGDLYEGQLLVAGGRITGLLDVDTAGPGERLDDLGCLLGHLSVLALMHRDRAAAIQRAGAGYLAAFEQVVDPAELRYRTAAVVLSLATGPHRVQERNWPAGTRARLELAELWLDSARRLRRRS